MTGTVGIVGLGIMGGAIARNLVAVGWRAVGFDIDPARCAELEDWEGPPKHADDCLCRCDLH